MLLLKAGREYSCPPLDAPAHGLQRLTGPWSSTRPTQVKNNTNENKNTGKNWILQFFQSELVRCRLLVTINWKEKVSCSLTLQYSTATRHCIIQKYLCKRVVQPSWLRWLTMAEFSSKTSSHWIIHSADLFSLMKNRFRKRSCAKCLQVFFLKQEPPPLPRYKGCK